MKKVILMAVALSAFGMANAQEVKFGAKAGVNASMVSGEEGGSDMKIGFHVGGLAEIKFNDKIALQPELMYSSEGGDYSYDGILFGTTNYKYEQEVKLSKIIMPIMLKYYFVPNFSIEAGPQLDYIISGKSLTTLTAFNGFKIVEDTDMDNSSQVLIQSDPGGNSQSFPITHDFDFKKLNFSFNIGLGYQLPSGLFFQGRYNLGITNFTENANFLGGTAVGDPTPIDATRVGESFKSSNIQISAGYKF